MSNPSSIQAAALPAALQAPIPASIDALANQLESQAAGSFQDALKSQESNEAPAIDVNAAIEAAKENWEKEQQRIEKVGQDFEALFFSMMLKEMRNSVSSEEGGGMFAGEGSDTYGGMFDTFIGNHMATTGQLGLADMVTKSLAARFGRANVAGVAQANPTDQP